MRSFLLSLAALATAAAGLYAATIVAPARATTVALADLPGLGYSLALRADLSSSPPCSNYWVTGGNGAPETLIGDPNHLACTTPEEMQARIDALLAAYPPTPAPPVPPELPTVTVTTTETVTLPAETTTIATTTTAMTTATVAGPTVTLTTTLPAETVTQTVTVQAPPPDPEWLTALALRSQALNALYRLGA